MASLGKRMARAAGWQFLGNLLRVGLGMAASVLIVRWLGAVEFGKASWILSLTLYFSILGSLGLGTPFTRHLTRVRLQGDRAGLRKLLRRMVGLRLGAGSVFVLLFLVFQFLPEELTAGVTARPLLVFVPTLLVVSYLHGMAFRILQVFFQQCTVMLLTSLEIVLKVAVLWLLGGATGGARDLLIAAVAAEFASLLVATAVVWHLSSRMEAGNGPAETIPGMGGLMRAGRAPWLLSLSERVLGREVDVLLLGTLAGPAEVARYALPFSLATLSLSLAGSVFQSTTNLAVFTEASREGSRRLLRVLLEYWMIFVLPLAVGGMLLGDRLLVLLYGETGRGTGLVSLYLFGALALYHLAGQIKDALQGLGEDGRPTRAHLAGGALNLILSVMWIPAHGAEGAALATLLGAVTINIWQGLGLPVVLRVLPGRRSMAATVGALAAMAAAVLYLDLRVGEGWGYMLMLVALGAALYFLVLGFVGPHSSLRSRLPASSPIAGVARRVL